ncbi:MAG: beta-propeller domain-containing protein [Candidatus Bathyarchaeota archaeon]|nr:beta-propeller domain-containing protein [Candidatus Bathyarchaeota archaeon]
MFNKEVKKKSWTFAVLAVLLASMLSAVVYFGYTPGVSLRTFSSYDELNSFVESNSLYGYPNKCPSYMSEDVQAAGGDSARYSNTNIQVAGVDEADTVKTDGYFIYASSNVQHSVYIMDANPQNASILSKITLPEFSEVAGIYLSQDSTKIVVLGSNNTLRTATDMYLIESYSTSTFVKIYDISDKMNPVLVRDFSASGNYFNSRMIGNYVYAVLNQPVQVINDTATLPTVCEDNIRTSIQPSQIYYIDKEDNYCNYFSYTSIVGININNNEQTVANLTVMMGGASNLYVSTNNMYITCSGLATYSLVGGQSEANTEIYRVQLEGETLSFDAKGNIPGNILNQYSMDESNGYFRAATNVWRDGKQQNNVYVLNMDLSIVGKLENLASGESLHSARFMGDKCYLVTFKNVDPLFVIDLSQPTNPNVLGELKVPGYSDYLHPYDDTHLIGVGKETIETDESALYQGLKLSLFDVSNVNDPKQMAKVEIGDRGTDSPALSDPKAFLFDSSKNLLVLPVNLAQISTDEGDQDWRKTSSYGTTVWQGVYVYDLTLSGGFELKGTISQIDAQVNPTTEHNSWITRALYIDNTLYTVSEQKVQLNSLTDMGFIAQIELS